MRIKKLIDFFSGIEKYIMISLIGVVVLYSLNFLGVGVMKLPPSYVYFFSTLVNLFISYFLYLKAFREKPSRENIIKYIINLVVFFLLSNVLFNIMIKKLDVHYLIAITINMMIFPLFKFASYKYLVFKPRVKNQ